MGREEAKAQSKAAAQEKCEAARLKKEARREKQWAQGAKDNSKADAVADKAAASAQRKAAARAQLEAEGGVVEEPKAAKSAAGKRIKCPGCGKFNVITKKKPCPNCTLGK